MELSVIVHPRAKKKKAVQSPRGLEIYINSPPVDGKANKEIIESIAKSLKIAKSKISIKKGDKSKNKIIEIQTELTEMGIIKKIIENWK